MSCHHAGMDIASIGSTIPSLFALNCEKKPDAAALAVIDAGKLRWRTWGEIAADVDARIGQLHAAGIGAGDHVAQVAVNSYEWVLNDLALLTLGAVHVPIHTTLSAEQIAWQIEHSRSKLVIAREGEIAARVRRALRQTVPMWEETGDRGQGTEIGSPCEISIRNPGYPPRAKIRDSLATILYTSGTTAQPRGVMLTHGNLAVNALSTSEAVGGSGDELRLGFLPLSHIYARTCELYVWIARGSRLVLAENRETIFRDLQLVRPTAIGGVPYFYQKLSDRVRDGQDRGEPITLRAMLGGEIRRCYCGGAAIAPEIESLFAAEGIPVLSGYGLTEASPVVSAQSQTQCRAGTVGPPVPDVEVRIADDGEILVRGENVMQGYWRDEAATNQSLRDGWLYTGDIGVLDNGFLTVHGRKKELIVLSTGKKIAPARLEALLCASPLIEQVAVVGDGRSGLGALIVPTAERLRHEIRRRRLFVWSKRRALNHPVVRQLYAQEIADCLAGCAREEQIHHFTILGRGFSIEAGEVTPKLSMCRQVVERNFAREIDAMYAAHGLGKRAAASERNLPAEAGVAANP